MAPAAMGCAVVGAIGLIKFVIKLLPIGKFPGVFGRETETKAKSSTQNAARLWAGVLCNVNHDRFF